MEKKKHISLDEIGNKLPFTVPENYFENFALQLEDQVMLKPVPAFRLLRPWMYMAAMFLGIFFMSRIIYTVYEDNKALVAENYDLYVMSQVDETEIMVYYMGEEK